MKRLIYAFLILFLSSCHPVFCTWNLGYKQLDKKPERSNIVGFYQLNEKSKEYLKETYTEWPLKLELNNDGYYNFINSSNVKTGKWSVSCEESYACLLELEGISVEPLRAKNGKLAIQVTIGDGDNCEGIIYEKIAN
jgi:hypothetical protein